MAFSFMAFPSAEKGGTDLSNSTNIHFVVVPDIHSFVLSFICPPPIALAFVRLSVISFKYSPPPLFFAYFDKLIILFDIFQFFVITFSFNDLAL